MTLIRPTVNIRIYMHMHTNTLVHMYVRVIYDIINGFPMRLAAISVFTIASIDMSSIRQ